MLRKSLDRFGAALDDGLTKTIFDHVRNFLMCAFLLALGTTEFRDHPDQIIAPAGGLYAGTAVILISCCLFALNLYDGIRRLSRFRWHRLLTVVLIATYAIVSLRLVEIAWHFRSG